jgi:hypothetical protein
MTVSKPEDGAVGAANGDDGDAVHPVEEIESLCMQCHENVRHQIITEETIRNS